MITTDVNILIADDHKIIRDGLRLMLSLQNKEFNFFITEATNGGEAIALCLKKDFDIVLLDYQMPKFNGDDVAQRIRIYKPKSKIIILSNYDERSFVQSSVNKGVSGYILKDINTEDLLTAIRTVLDGGTYFSVNVQEKTLEENGQAPEKDIKQLSRQLGLSSREIEVLQLIANELTNEEIAKKLTISKRTVDTHRMNLLFKLRAKNTVGLIKFAYNNKLVD
jgi:DNA-binding NarL/FixJ family response regulator